MALKRFTGLSPGAVVVMIDTGMVRFGCQPQEFPDIIQACRSNGVPIHSIMTHFADPSDEEFTKNQLGQFMEAVKPYRDSGVKLHVANTPAFLSSFGADFDFVRTGIAMFGQVQDPRYGLQPAIEWLARPTLIKHCQKDQSVGYCRLYRCPEDERIAVVPVGFGDGYSTRNINKGVLTTPNGSRCQVIGRISMGALTVKLPEKVEDVRELCVMTADFNEVNSSFAIAKNNGISESEVLTRLSVRLPRLYVLNGQLIKD